MKTPFGLRPPTHHHRQFYSLRQKEICVVRPLYPRTYDPQGPDTPQQEPS